jgi:hypothetical protein
VEDIDGGESTIGTDSHTAMVTSFVAVPPPRCARGDDAAWVWEATRTLPSDISASPSLRCEAPGMPYPDCNPCGGPDEPPKIPPGFRITVDDKGPRD